MKPVEPSWVSSGWTMLWSFWAASNLVSMCWFHERISKVFVQFAMFFSDRFCLAWHTFSIKGLVLILERNNRLIMIDDSPKMLRRSRSQREIAAGSWVPATFWSFLAEGAWCSYIRYFTVFACFASVSILGHFLLLYRAPFMLKSLPQLQPWKPTETLATAFSAR